ncbi:MAG: hypothetical protein HY756_03670 [Nitrospirae bacterium]|nr:hypothetical protein [Nitrospirota bacterium]
MNKRTTLAIIIILISVALSFLTVFYNKQNTPVCSYDGTRIEPIYEVDIKQKDGRLLRFCSVYCAKGWFKEKPGEVDSVIVTDEITGEKIDAAIAFFVESEVVAIEATQNRIHAFKNKEYAVNHARQYKGKIIDNPFSLKER